MIDIDVESLRLIGLTNTITSQLHLLHDAPPEARLVPITEIQREWLTVHDGQQVAKWKVMQRAATARSKQKASERRPEAMGCQSSGERPRFTTGL
ncbi:hypothetical protein [Duganella sp. BuS-21]|uniref:hypothetical protein n=1 Tax=Duganella sp. BuS-21 TaxID=2943848 RepID=UPI0035A5CC66